MLSPDSAALMLAREIKWIVRWPRWTLLCCVNWRLRLEKSVELAGDVADQAALDLAVGLALGTASPERLSRKRTV
jgi:hypothetical protein